MQPKGPFTGARYMLVSALGFALMAACVKLVATRGIPLLEIVAARSLVSLVISYVDVRRKGLSLWGTHRALLAARGVVGALALICVYYAVMTLPLAEATLLQYMHPMFTALLGLLLLGEGIQRSTVICILFSITGLIVMVEPGVFSGAAPVLPTFSVAVALAGAFGSAVAYVLVRRLSLQEDASVIIFYFPLIALPLSVALLGNQFVMPDGESLVLLLMVGIFTQVGQLGLTHAMRYGTAGKTAAYSYIQVIFAVTLGWLVFGELPSLWTWVGGGLIITGALLNLIRR
jgi:drug/metabolite transporter (DMT)-like permease|tara:strand:- start:14674 stop:15537 length:864 start_codon:yes stop_codon:yes gene_type:complete